mgnify:CR=1 FL=1
MALQSAHNLKNSDKNTDFLRRWNFWHVGGMRGRTGVSIRLQEGLRPRSLGSTCMVGIGWKAANQNQILKEIEDLKRPASERNLSLTDTEYLLFAPIKQVDSSGKNREALKASYHANKSNWSSKTLKDKKKYLRKAKKIIIN